MNTQTGKTAIVIGGGIAGLLAARAISHEYQVTILEHDQYPESPGFRPGTPQARHLHLFLLQGQHIVEQFFPGICAELIHAGAVECDFVQDGIYSFVSGRVQRGPSQLRGISCSRILWEWHIRQRLLQQNQIHFQEGVEVTGLVQAPDQHAIIGVRTRPRGNISPGAETVVSADLVLDASGRTSQTPRWLEQLGYPSPDEEIVNAHLGYASRCYPRDREMGWAFAGVQIQAPARLKGAGLFPVEHNQWTAVLMGSGKNWPPTNEDGFLEFVTELADPIIAEAIRTRPGGPIYGYRNTQNCFRHYERLRMPAGLLVLGDAFCTFNPSYGQGMTVAALEAMALRKALRQSGNNLQQLGKAFYAQASKIVSFPWLLATSSDNRVPTVEPPPRLSWATRILYWYNDALLELVPHDERVRDAFFAVWHMLRPSYALFSPALFVRVLIYRLTRHWGNTKTIHQERLLRPLPLSEGS